ncbi:MAG TPA: transaldolase family protein [Dehalococcoidia bacterium]|nr:transaldolase family protein [Dehalococcoidia bacterium]
MQIFLDSANVSEVRRWLAYGVLDGVTTNPSILLKDGGYDTEARAREIAELIHPRPVSVEVYSNDPEEMLEQARSFAGWASNIVVKIPVINEFGEPSLGVVKALVEEGIKVNMTACLSFGQVVLGAKAGATYISIFAGRVADEGNDAPRLVHQSAQWLKAWGYSSRIIVGSVREVFNIQEAALAGAHIITVPPQFMEKLIDHRFSRATVGQFNDDARKTMAKIQELRARIRA